jgi:hypothetical protein
MKGQVEDVDVKAFNDVMNDFDGYDVYKIDDKRYVRFNNTAFVSNYKRNDLLSTQMTLYCINVGSFKKRSFYFLEQLNKMDKMFNGINANKTLADIDCSTSSIHTNELSLSDASTTANDIELYDVIYACIVNEKKGE